MFECRPPFDLTLVLVSKKIGGWFKNHHALCYIRSTNLCQMNYYSKGMVSTILKSVLNALKVSKRMHMKCQFWSARILNDNNICFVFVAVSCGCHGFWGVDEHSSRWLPKVSHYPCSRPWRRNFSHVSFHHPL